MTELQSYNQTGDGDINGDVIAMHNAMKITTTMMMTTTAGKSAHATAPQQPPQKGPPFVGRSAGRSHSTRQSINILFVLPCDNAETTTDNDADDIQAPRSVGWPGIMTTLHR